MNEQLERVVLDIIADGRARCGAGFGKYPIGIRSALKHLEPLVAESERVRVALVDFDARLNRD